ncbi:tyrosine-protein phosphatase [Ferrimicrobium sp.]|uniref:tyrosine-protein phosphatase n=1 Tax=Ferrimicrobium sp. TaxID=2926050 RepID=UPI0026248BFC|nr:tyrosine-protein phosphatase [Ferrimicrobium sp.]
MDTFKIADERDGQRMIEEERWVPLDGAANVRDLGGYPVGQGGVVRLREIFRGDSPHRLSPNDVERLRAVGIRTRIDLRREEELNRFGSGHIGEVVAITMHTPLRPTLGGETGEASRSLRQLYQRYLLQCPYELVGALRFLAEPQYRPALFHCYAGKDRTGVLTALLLAALGASDEVIVADYAKTILARDAFIALAGEELRASFGAEDVLRPDSPALAADPETMAGTLDWLRATFGSVQNYLEGAGLSCETIGRLRSDLVVA